LVLEFVDMHEDDVSFCPLSLLHGCELELRPFVCIIGGRYGGHESMVVYTRKANENVIMWMIQALTLEIQLVVHWLRVMS
jgi:hypothetical protein